MPSSQKVCVIYNGTPEGNQNIKKSRGIVMGENWSENIDGIDNRVIYGEDVRKIKGLINIKGNNNYIFFDNNSILNNISVTIESNDNYIYIGKRSRVTFRCIQKLTNGNKLYIGDDTSIGGANIINGEGKHIKIGNDCMLSYGIDIRGTDSHAIFEIKNNERVNHAKDIIIDDHVWIGAHATILKGTHIRKNSVLAIRAVISNKLEKSNVVLAGNPARIVKENITWDRPLLG